MVKIEIDRNDLERIKELKVQLWKEMGIDYTEIEIIELALTALEDVRGV